MDSLEKCLLFSFCFRYGPNVSPTFLPILGKPKGCNAMYVEDIKDGKRTYRHIFYHTFLNMVSFECNAICVKDVKIDQIHLRAVMLCMSKMLKMSKMGKEHTHTFWLITSLILNGLSIRKMFWKAET